MRFPRIASIPQAVDMVTYFRGYNHTHACQDGEFFETENITTENYPVLSTRNKRGKVKTFNALNGVLDKEKLVHIDGDKLFIDNEEKTLAEGVTISTSEDMLPKTMAKMGAFVIIMPDGIWYNVDDDTNGYMNNETSFNGSVSFTLCGADGNNITVHQSSEYPARTPEDGEYKISTVNDKTSLQVYSSATGLWASVPTTYMKISATGIGKGFEKGDGVKIEIDLTSASWDYAKNIFVNEDGNKRNSNFVIASCEDDYVIVTALLNENKTLTLPITVSRKAPDMAFITECQNRLWGCSKDGHEIYCSKLGDVKNWNVFAGISTDSWAATVGSDGVFTGAITYNRNPIFFKEDLLVLVTQSAQGNHSYRDLQANGVELGSDKSLCIVNGILYYKAPNGVYAYDGSVPVNVSNSLGEVRYHDAVGGTINNRYYLSMQDDENKSHLFVFDTKNNLWAREDSTKVRFFVKHNNDLYFVKDESLYSVLGTNADELEKEIKWSVESGNIGFYMPNNKNISRIDLRVALALTSYVSLYIQYDSDGSWHHLYNMSGKGIRSFNVSVKPHRCDHFKYKIVGHGDCKIFSISKTIEEGSNGL